MTILMDVLEKCDIKSILMFHEGGTKFYEIISIVSSSDSCCVNINRYGSVSKLEGGGTFRAAFWKELLKGSQSANKVLSVRRGRGYEIKDELNLSRDNSTAQQRRDFLQRIGAVTPSGEIAVLGRDGEKLAALRSFVEDCRGSLGFVEHYKGSFDEDMPKSLLGDVTVVDVSSKKPQIAQRERPDTWGSW